MDITWWLTLNIANKVFKINEITMPCPKITDILLKY